ncbi:MAG: bifunctional diaminohydroxyphosphoribosylaminopyrimidine deaminase/5-amino-6-(5-phosphoribosylamino)uracil reductase RibD [Planctomycetota bacterium]|nr:bifunctional diaminohydroxyphosphoribosylaminopyrimidine deaminase/5-amino-6-(5-phosphoribosylamino)uracil reductase RibD [Planctomycetota bacterium]
MHSSIAVTSDAHADTHEFWISRAIELAQRGRGSVEPNPMVGCVVVKDGKSISEGFHERFGEPHAEVTAISKLPAADVEGSTVYVTLEPCAHFGKTPPCVDLLLRSKPHRVVIGLQDPFPEVAGRGIQQLREAGIDVVVGINADACERLMAPYLKRLRTGLPWIIAKWAMTLDGRLATHRKDSKWVTSEQTRQHSHRVRSCVDGIMIGVGTLLADDPMLNARAIAQGSDASLPYALLGNRNPTRIVMDRQARTPVDSRLVQSSGEHRTMIVCGPTADSRRVDALREHGCEVVVCSNESSPTMIQELSKILVPSGMTNLLVDGGPRLIGNLIDHQLVDELHVYIAPKIVGGTPTVVPNNGQGVLRMDLAHAIKNIRRQLIGEDLFLSGFCHYVK